MKISPMDIQRQAFGRQLRGFNREDVRTYLNLVAEEVAALQRERDALAQEVQGLRGLIDEHRERETILKNTLLTAQRGSEEIRDNARKPRVSERERWSFASALRPWRARRTPPSPASWGGPFASHRRRLRSCEALRHGTSSSNSRDLPRTSCGRGWKARAHDDGRFRRPQH